MQEAGEIWSGLSSSLLLSLALTLLAFQIGMAIYQRANMNPLLNPVLIAIILIVLVLEYTGTPYSSYFMGAQFIHFLLGPATVALAIPLYRQFVKVRQCAFAITLGILGGSITAAGSAVLIGMYFDISPVSLLSIAPKSVTAPVAMGIAEELGGLPSLTAVLVIATGITGAMIGPHVLAALRITDLAASGLALGTASHGTGTARAMQMSEAGGAFASLAMGSNALLTALLMPFIWALAVA
jgi:predicted murein hydrolase (TIGR00659 family)